MAEGTLRQTFFAYVWSHDCVSHLAYQLEIPQFPSESRNYRKTLYNARVNFEFLEEIIDK